MTETILTTILSSALYITSSAFVTHAPAQQVVLTQVLHETNYVVYTTGEKETLAQIAQKQYGSDAYWTTLWNDNEWIGDPDTLKQNDTIKIRSVKPQQPESLKQVLAEKETVLAAQKDKDYLAQINQPTAMPTAQPVTPAQPTVTSGGNFDAVYKDAGAKYGVPWQILYGLHKTESGQRDGAIGGGGGPQGPMQFMPGTFNAYAVDGNGDGTADINSATDAIYTAANFMAKHGSVQAGLRSYGGNNAGVLAIAQAAGYNQ